MAYFSNGTEGMELDELCSRCVHGWDADKEENRNSPDGRACAVYMLQMDWNYAQCERTDRGTTTVKKKNCTFTYKNGEPTERAIIMKQALDTLIPDKHGVLCAMFVEIDQEDK